MREWTVYVVLAIVGGWTAGCHTGKRETVMHVESARIDADLGFDAVWRAADQVLHEHLYTLNMVDERSGRITTHAVESQHFFEFWRRDVVTGDDWAEATIKPMRRWVEITIEVAGRSGDEATDAGGDEAVQGGDETVGGDEAVQDDDEAWPTGTTTITVIVHKEQFSTPERQYNSSAAAFHFFGTSLPAVASGRRLQPGTGEWIDRGRDPALEEYLLAAILDRADKVALAGAS